MLRLTGPDNRLCDGLPRREFLRVGGLSALGLAAARFAALSCGDWPESKGQELHSSISDGRSAATIDLGSETGRARRDSR